MEAEAGLRSLGIDLAPVLGVFDELPPPLISLLEAHRNAHAPHYSPRALSDHGPMAYLAMHGLGMNMVQIGRFAAIYRQRLDTLPPAPVELTGDTWRTALGKPDSYPAFVAFFDAEIHARGSNVVVATYLPLLISGWVTDLFHPLIRLAYGLEFRVPTEVAAGLAYLAQVGREPALVEAASGPQLDARGRSFLDRLRVQGSPSYVQGPGSFNRSYANILAHAELFPAGGTRDEVYADMSQACLEVFHSTHDFFALHLLTACHAFRVCSPWAGPHADRLFSIGIGAGFLAIGAPPARAVVPHTNRLPTARLSASVDEHDFKLAYTCRALTRADADPSYESAAHSYLSKRLGLDG